MNKQELVENKSISGNENNAKLTQIDCAYGSQSTSLMPMQQQFRWFRMEAAALSQSDL